MDTGTSKSEVNHCSTVDSIFPIKTHTYTKITLRRVVKISWESKKIRKFCTKFSWFHKKIWEEALSTSLTKSKKFPSNDKIGNFWDIKFCTSMHETCYECHVWNLWKANDFKNSGFFSFLRGPLILKFKCLSMCF